MHLYGRRACIVVVLTLLGIQSLAAAVVEIDAGPFDRHNVVVTFPSPKAVRSPFWLKRGSEAFVAQSNDDGTATAIVSRLEKDKRHRFEISPTPAATTRGVQILVEHQGQRLEISRRTRSAAERPTSRLFSYQAEPGSFPRENIKESFRRGGYIHPIFAPNGKIVTDDFPPNHIHHHGVWWAWTLTEFQGRKPDFWNMGENKGRVEFAGVEKTWNGPVHGGFRARHQFVDLLAKPPVTALNETWTVTAYATPADDSGSWYFDIESRQQCATVDSIRLPEYRYGGIGLRGNWAWNGKTNVSFVTSEGETDREKGNATRGRWCDMSGLVDGELVGITVLGHPANYRSPQPMRLHPTEPFFNFAPQQAGDMEIKPGEAYVSRYRFLVHNGAANSNLINRVWNDFAHPPTAKVLEGD